MNIVHGKNIISVDGDIIMSKVIGAFNLEAIDRAISDLKSVISGFSNNEFKLLVDYTNAECETSEIYEKLNACNLWLSDQNMVSKALILNPKDVSGLLESRTPARVSLNERIFDNTPSAIIWLQSQ